MDMGYRVAVIATDETADEYKDVTVTSIGTRESEDTIVNNLCLLYTSRCV